MKKTTNAVLVSLLFMSTCAMSQSDEVNVYWGKLNTMNKNASIHLLGKRGGDLLGYMREGKNVSVVKYSFDDLQVTGVAPIVGKGGDNIIPKDYIYDQMLFLKDKAYVCVTQFDKSTKENVLYAEEFDMAGQLVGGLKKIVSMSAKSRANRGMFDIVVSKDSTKFLLVDVPPYEKYSGEKFGFEVLDQDLNVLDNAEISLPNNFKYFEVPLNEISLSNDGIVYMLAKNIMQKEDKTKGEASYFFQLLAINPHGSGEVTTYDLKLPEKAITDISYSLEEGKYIICSGFYGNVKNSSYSTGQIDGVFYFRINKENKGIESTGLKALDHDFIADLTTERNADKGKGLSNYFTLCDFTRRADGGAVLVSEFRQTYEVEHYVAGPNGGGTMVTDIVYVRNNIIVININPDGSIKWYANIPKKQKTEDDDGVCSSFLMATHGDKMYFVYNDNPVNMQPGRTDAATKDIKTMAIPYKSTAVLVELSESGQFTKSTLFSNKQNNSIIEPAQALKINDDEFIVPAINVKSTCCFSKGANPTKYTLARFDFK